MTNQEPANEVSIDEAVARKLGWKHPPHSSRHWHNPEDDDRLYDAVPPYSTDIKAAWEILATLEKRGMYYTIQNLSTGFIFCRVGDEDVTTTAEEAFAPLAICKAFLALND